jgi:putative ABC transport system ATP-binding protein
MSTILEAINLSKVYETPGENTVALHSILLAIQKGESVAIIGKSGSGKSTLMHVLATLDRPSNGEVVIDGKSTSVMKSGELDELRNKKFGFVFQQFFLNGRNTVLENVTLPLMIMGVGASERNRRGMEILFAVGLANNARQKANDLSGGQKQRLCIARAMITNPDVIFADEPTGNLDTENGQIITELLFRMQKEKGITLIFVTHDPDLARLCDRIITIKDGEIVRTT